MAAPSFCPNSALMARGFRHRFGKIAILGFDSVLCEHLIANTLQGETDNLSHLSRFADNNAPTSLYMIKPQLE